MILWLRNVLFLLTMALLLLQCTQAHNRYKKQLSLLPDSIVDKLQKPNFINQARLGHLLFFDTKLSINNSKSCASCHNPDLYFTDGYKKTLGAYADVQMRNTPSLINSVFFKSLNWANPDITSFQQQMQTPLFSKAHFEMGMNVNDTLPIIEIFNRATYQPLIKNAPHTWQYIVECISLYCHLIVSRNSAYDFNKKNIELSDGAQLFFGEKYACYKCHGGIDFNEPVHDSLYFSNIQLHDAIFYATASDKGLEMITKKETDRGKFRVPSLRNVTETAPYGHDGSMMGFKNLIKLNGHFNYFSASEENQIMNEEDAYNLCWFLSNLKDTTVPQNIIFQNPLKD